MFDVTQHETQVRAKFADVGILNRCGRDEVHAVVGNEGKQVFVLNAQQVVQPRLPIPRLRSEVQNERNNRQHTIFLAQTRQELRAALEQVPFAILALKFVNLVRIPQRIVEHATCRHAPVRSRLVLNAQQRIRDPIVRHRLPAPKCVPPPLLTRMLALTRRDRNRIERLQVRRPYDLFATIQRVVERVGEPP